MNREDIVRMAREQGLPETDTEGVFIVNTDDLGRMLSAEREACAGIVVNEAMQYAEPVWAFEIVNDIKARGQA
jgi:hypothetical protein